VNFRCIQNLRKKLCSRRISIVKYSERNKIRVDDGDLVEVEDIKEEEDQSFVITAINWDIWHMTA
jgi:hypothetical protein